MPSLNRCALALVKGWLRVLDELGDSVQWAIGDGQSIMFWKDNWCGERSLMDRFPALYQIVESKNCRVKERWDAWEENHGWRIRFSMCIGEAQNGQAEILQGILRTISLSDMVNKMQWKGQSGRDYTAKQRYGWFIRNARVNNLVISKHLDFWRPKVPRKIKVFLWLAYQRRVLTKCYRAKCGICLVDDETADHLFCSCPAARMLWTALGHVIACDMSFVSIDELWRTTSSMTNRKDRLVEAEVRRYLIPAGLWSLWVTQNAVLF
ncbi:hypothetical protein QJS10_CPA01g00553 [Acorus calamus]|uniref:Reverse transcriptase zinc-binding domain-containing protein n=1 Tax=Acorus calamus TaxID=4465 RepID=A0AAV9FL71_ACOCL|nr:hypothetical protein QJS10_CPA01g00553 [Acorus calamus]